MATTTTKKRTVTKKPAAGAEEQAVPVVDEVTENIEVVEDKPVEKKKTPAKTVVKEKPVRQFNQNDLILCRSVTAGWLGCDGKSGQYYVFENFGDECEIEYQDLFALKSRHSQYIYAPLFVIEDEELLENPRWKDVAEFYDREVFQEDVEEVLSLPNSQFEKALKALPKGLAKTLQVKVAQKIEDGSFDSLKKIRIIDEIYGTDFRSILAE